MDRIRRDTLLGLVFFGTLAFLLWATINLTDMSMGKVAPLLVFFEDAGGAPPGTNVLVLGKKIGKTGEATIDYARPDRRVQIPLLLSEAVPLKVDYLIQVQDAGVLGGKQVYIEPGRGAPLPEGQELLGGVQKNAFERIGEIAEGRGPVGEELKGTLAAIRTAAEKLSDEQTSLGRLFTRRELYDEVLQSVQRLNGIFAAIQDGKSTFGRLAVDTAMGERFQHFLDNLARTSDALVGSEGTIGMLLNDRETAANLRAIVADVNSLVSDTKDGKGALGKLLRDETLASDLSSALADLSTLLKKANDPTAGVLGALSSDPDLAQDLKLTIANLRTVTEKLNGTDSLLGILISDKDVGIRFRRIITQVSRALEDAREAAPIANFVQVLFGVF
ncbi:MAG: MlaD family protein [Planctomycetota bacterium]|nr:MlaD family protein [Planctomycetota bacterium]